MNIKREFFAACREDGVTSDAGRCPIVIRTTMESIPDLVTRAKGGDVDAFGLLVQATQKMAFAVARSVLRDSMAAEDATQLAYLRAFRRLRDLQDPSAFPGWLRRLVVTVAINERRARRATFVRLDDIPDVPILDEVEDHWSESQRNRLAAALLTLSQEERQICDRRYHGYWTTARLAATAGIDESAMRKRLQRIRDKLRREVEMSEQRGIEPHELAPGMPGRVVELLAKPRLTALPEHPVGHVQELLRGTFPEFIEQSLHEVIDISEVRTLAADAVYVDSLQLHRVDDRRILRYDLTLPMLMTVRQSGQPLRLWATGKTYRVCREDSMHLEAFHQAEAFWLDDRSNLDAWQVTARVLRSVHAVLPGRTVKIVPTTYPMCSQAWELEVEDAGQWSEVLAWGVFNDRVLTHVGGDPAKHVAVGVGYGLERLAMLRYGIDDIRKIEVARVA